MAKGGDTTWFGVDYESLPSVRLLQQFMRIQSDPEGDQYAATLWLSGPLQAAGVEVTIEQVGHRKANLWATVEGEVTEPLILLNHLDVEPVLDPDSWPYPPFSASLAPPLLHGRGGFDMKSYTVAQLLATLALKSRPAPPNRSLTFLATADEETGSDLGIRWLLRERPELLTNSWAVLTEGGLVETRGAGDIKFWAIEFGQQKELAYEVCAGTEKRLLQLRKDLLFLNQQRLATRTSLEVRQSLESYGLSRDRADLRDQLADLDRLSRDPARFRDLPFVIQKALSVGYGLSTPEFRNGQWYATLYLYLPPEMDIETSRRIYLPEWTQAGLRLAPTPTHSDGGISNLDHPAVDRINAYLSQTLSSSQFGPFFLTSAKTDSRFLRQAKIPSYGWTPFDLQVTNTTQAGTPGERIDLPGFASGIDRYRELVSLLVE